MTVDGQDWSSYQDAQPPTTGLSFVFIKATEGTSYVNPRMAEQASWARKNNLVVGFYHFLRPGSMSDQVKFFLDKAPKQAGDILALDWEDGGVNCASKDEALAALKASSPNHKTVLYCNRDTWLGSDTTSQCGDGLWIADYTVSGVTPGQPRIQHPWTFHQYTDTPIDKDLANFPTVAALKAWADVSAPATVTPQWRKLLDHLLSVPEKIYENWTTASGWDNSTPFGDEYGENNVPWCVIFNWDMYHGVGLDAIVPKTDNVSDFTSRAKTSGQWSEYPSVGAWVNFGDGAHTEVVVGFDSTNVYTKGGNSIQAGSTDNGQGNGVWSHQELRTSPRVVGYFAPHFPDGVCPPTADPADPRGGKPVASWTPNKPVPPSKPTPKPSVSLAHVVAAAKHDPAAPQGATTYKAEVLLVEKALLAEGLLDAKYAGDGSYGTLTVKAYRAWQRRCGFSGADADGIPGIQTLTKLGQAHGFSVTK